MIMILILTFLSSCRYKNKIISFFYKGTSLNYNDVTYEIERIIRINNIEIFKKNFILVKNPKKEKLILKDLEGNTLLALEDKKLIFNNAKEKIPFTTNKLNEIIYYTFLYPSFETKELLNLLNAHKFYEKNENKNLSKISFDKGYFIYNCNNKTLKELSFLIEEKGKILQNKITFNYKKINKNLLLDNFKLEIKIGQSIILMEEKLIENTLSFK